MVSIYTLCDPASGEVRYLGMSRKPALRLAQYKARGGGHTKRLSKWLESIARDPQQIILEMVPLEVADQREREWIELLRSYGTPLLNWTSGGEGRFDIPAEHKAKLRALRRAEVAAGTHNFLRPEVQARAAAKRKGRAQPWAKVNVQKAAAACRGRKLTEEHKQKCSVALTGKTKSTVERQQIGTRVAKLWADPVWAAKMRAALTGLPHRSMRGVAVSAALRRGVPLTSEHRVKVSAGQKATWTPERRAAASQARKGKLAHPMTDEMRAKISISVRAYFAQRRLQKSA